MRPAKALIDLAAVRHNLREARRRAGGARGRRDRQGQRLWPRRRPPAAGAGRGRHAGRRLHRGGAGPARGRRRASRSCSWRACSRPRSCRLCARLGLRRSRSTSRASSRCWRPPASTRPLTVWLKLDTGMNRLGFRAVEAAGAAYARLRDCAAVAEVRLMTHFASADEPTDPATRRPDRALRRGRRATSASPARSATRPACSPGPRPMPNGSARASCSTASRRCPAAPARTRACAPVMTLDHRA